MKREPEIVRAILLEMEQAEVNHFKEKLAFSGILEKGIDTENGKENQIRAEHIRWMIDGGLLDHVPGASGYFRVTAKGCDFLDAIRDGGIWEKTKAAVAETGGNAALEIIKAIAIGYVRKQLKDCADIEI